MSITIKATHHKLTGAMRNASKYPEGCDHRQRLQ